MGRQLTKEEKQTTLTCRNYDDSCIKALNHLDNYLNKYAFQLRNAIGSIDDYRQELKLKTLKVFRQYEFELTILRNDSTIQDLIYMAVRIIHNRYADLSMEFSKKKDTSLFTSSLDDNEERNPDKDLYEAEISDSAIPIVFSDNQVDILEVDNLVQKLIENLKVSEMPYETIGYLKESISPSASTEKRYEKWLRITNPKNPHKNKGIPAKVICEELGIEYSKMGKIKEIIALNLVKLGISPSLITSCINVEDDTWRQYGLKKPRY